MSGNTQSTYTSLISSEHADKPKFMATIALSVQPFIDAQTVLGFLAIEAFDIDEAVGVQLDRVGLWVGRTREVRTPISGVYFSFDTLNLGFDQGNWQGQFDPTTGITLLDDTTYRALLYAKIIMNTWDGSTTQAAAALDKIFSLSPRTFATIQDNQDMTMTVGISGNIPPASIISLLQNDEFDVNPVGVGINYFITSVNTVALFGFDIQDKAIAGFDTGAWAGQPGTAPGQVLSFAATSVTANSAVFTWIAPNTGVGPYTYQVLYAVTNSNDPYSYSPVVSTTRVTVTGLAANTSYTATVYAISSAGPGPESPTIVFSTSIGVPAKVVGLHSTATTINSISIAWLADAGAQSYQVLYRIAGTTAWAEGPTTISVAATLTGLTAGTIYDITVFAINIIGQSPLADVLQVGTTGSIPGTVTGFVATAVGEFDIAISWLNPITGNGPFAFAVQYAVNVAPITYQHFGGSITLTALGGSCDIPNLASATQYLVQVAASNLGGSGPYSAPLAITTSSGPPNQVDHLISSVINPTDVTLQWDAVTNAVKYQMQYKLMGHPTWINGPLINAPEVSGTIIGLTVGGSYNFRVYAIGP